MGKPWALPVGEGALHTIIRGRIPISDGENYVQHPGYHYPHLITILTEAERNALKMSLSILSDGIGDIQNLDHSITHPLQYPPAFTTYEKNISDLKR